jgi:hypothetical protein
MREETELDQRDAGRSINLARFWPALVPLIAIAFFFNEMVFSNLILARGDTYVYFYPYWHAAAEALRLGRIPLWNTDLFMGAPFLANSQAGLFYPLNWPLWLLLPTPYAVSASVVLHLVIASGGAYLAGRRCLSLSRTAALIAALLFALGGYLTAQIEHVNQLQGLAWLPWFFVVSCAWPSSRRSWRALARTTLAVAFLLALQLLAGHFQTAFIILFGLLIWLIASLAIDRRPRGENLGRGRARPGGLAAQMLYFALPLVLGGVLALLVSSIQLLPALELAGLSSRQGGLPVNEVLSFSLHPLLLTRSLLPTYGQSLFTEYVALLPLTAILLALLGGWNWRSRPGVVPFAVVAVAGILLAFGVFNPGYHLLARLPLFNLFRAPARWLALYALGMALLAGAGWDVIMDRRSNVAEGRRPIEVRKPLRIGLVVLVALMVWGLLSVPLARFVPVGGEVTVELPSGLTWLGWAVELTVAYLLLSALAKRSASRGRWGLVLLAVSLLALFLATRTLPYNNLTTPEAFFNLRPPVARLQAMTACDDAAGDCATPPARLLSLSDIFFDVGDQPEIDAMYVDQLSDGALYDNTIAVKQKEVLAPNLPLLYGLPSVDGFDGGILPLRNFTTLSRLILPEGEETTDGRLRENLDAVPDNRWLDMFNARYLITDKVADSWREGVFFDLQHPVMLFEGGESADVGHVPTFEADQLWLVADGSAGQVEIVTAAGDTWRLEPAKSEGDSVRVIFPQPAVAQNVSLIPCERSGASDTACLEPWRVRGLTLVDTRDEAFQPLVLGQYRLIHSGDVKIYENLDVLPRAFFVNDWEFHPEAKTIVEAMQHDAFDPARKAALVGEGPAPPVETGSADVRFLSHEAEGFTVSTASDVDGLLIVTDAHYPGWEAKLDGEPTEIYLADGYFRGVFVTAGEHEVTFSYEPASYGLGRAMSALGVLALLVLAVAALRSERGRGKA